MSVVLGVRQVCDGPDCESPDVEGEVCYAPLGAAGWITWEQDGEVRHFCEDSCELGWLKAMHRPASEYDKPVFYEVVSSCEGMGDFLCEGTDRGAELGCECESRLEREGGG